MKKSGDDGCIIQALFCQDSGYSDGMGEVRFARMAELAFMHLFTEVIGIGDPVRIGLWIVVADQSNQVFW